MASNPGINRKVKDFYCDRLAIKYDPKMKMDIPAENLNVISNDEMSRLSTFEIKLRNYKKKQSKMWKAEEVEKYLINKTIKPILSKISVRMNTDSNDMAIHRVLGHKERMPGHGQWIMEETVTEDSCWVCDRWTYSLYFWNQEIGMFNDTNRIGVDKATKKKIVDSIRIHNPGTYMDHPEVPVMFSNITNWRPKPFMHILTFLDTLEDGDEPDYEKVVLADA